MPDLVLLCKQCRWRPPTDTVMEAVALHMEVEHDTDDISMEMVAWCERCDLEMPLEEKIPHRSGSVVCVHRCTRCKRRYDVRQAPEGNARD